MHRLNLEHSKKYREVLPEGSQYVFAMKWDKDLGIFDVHGLWPENRERNYNVLYPKKDHPSFLWTEVNICSTGTQELYKLMKQYYHSSLHLTDEAFWEHEWEHHGMYMYKTSFDEDKKNLSIIIDTPNPLSHYFAIALCLYLTHKDTVFKQIDANYHTQIYLYLDKLYNVMEVEHKKL